jgi:hypothetical protein
LRRLVCLAVLALASACGAPEGDVAAPKPGGASDDPNVFRADRVDERPYAGEWAMDTDACRDKGKVWTIESNRMGMRRERFCVFSEIRVSRGAADGEAWRADAQCLADGQQSEDVVFFRVKASGLQMRVTINDADAIDLVRCPMST